MNYDIIVVAGQSNAQGNGLGNEDKRLPALERVYQFTDQNPPQIYFDENYKTRIRAVLPVECEITLADERLLEDGTHAAEFSQSFAREYVERGYLKDGRNLLIVKAAVGGTGFTKEQWGLGNILYTRLLQMVDAALKTGDDNKIVAFLWHQGEHDAFERLNESDEAVFHFYRTQFDAMTQDFLKRYSQFKFPIIAGDFCKDWADGFSKPAAVRKATEKVVKQLGNAGFVSSDGLLSNNEVTFSFFTLFHHFLYCFPVEAVVYQEVLVFTRHDCEGEVG